MIGAAAIALASYLGGYAIVRMTGEMTHFENRGYPEKGHEIRYPRDQWSDLWGEMAEDSGNPLLRGQSAKPRVLDVIFYPLRKIEAGIWNIAD